MRANLSLTDQATRTPPFHLPPWADVVIQLLASMLVVAIAAVVLERLTFRMLLLIPDVASASYRREDRATRFARAAFPDDNLARTRAVQSFRPPDGTAPGVSERQWARIRELQDCASASTMERWARLAYARDRSLQLARRFWRPFSRPLRVANLLCSAAIVVWLTSAGRHTADTAIEAVVSVWHTLSDVTPSRILPFALILVGAFVVARPTPLIDRIRARDEAAKDANRLLAEMNSGIVALVRAIDDWAPALQRQRHEIVDQWVGEQTRHRYSWYAAGGLSRERTRTAFGQPATIECASLTSAMTRLMDTRAKIDDAGLRAVAVRLTWKVYASADWLNLITTYGSPRELSLHLPTPARVSAYIDGAGHGIVRRYRSVDHDDPAAVSRFERDLEREAFAMQRILDMDVAELHVARLHALRVATFLHRRMLGTWWSRSLSLVQK